MQYPIIDNLIYAYQRNGWTGLDIPETITYEPIQLGTGTPSLENIRPIIPATTLNIGGIDVPVYGGTLDVTTRVLTVNMAIIDMGSRNWSYIRPTTGIPYGSFYNTINGKKYSQFDVICSAYPTKVGFINDKSIQGNSGASTVYVVDSTFNGNTNEFKSAMNGIQLVYELTTPITYQLTTEELYIAAGFKDDIAHRLRLPLVRNFPHPVIDALISAADGQQTEEEKEILRHYLTPLGIGGI